MKTFKGTKAPWIIDYLDSENICIQLNSGTIEVWSTIEDQNGETLTFEQAQANAKLIAAAPELLEALQDCLTTLQNLDNTIEVISDHQTYFNSTRNSMELAEKALNKAL